MSHRVLRTLTQPPPLAVDTAMTLATQRRRLAFGGMTLGGDEVSWVVERLLARTVDQHGCWAWQGYAKNGYPVLSLRNRHVYGHRFALTLATGVDPVGKDACHRCDVRRCWRFDHLFAGTRAENVADAVAKGRASRPPHVSGETCGKTTLHEAQLTAIRDAEGSQREVARAFGVAQSTVWRIRHGLERVAPPVLFLEAR